MSKAFEEIAKEASQLSRQQKFDLAGLLLDMNEDLPASEADLIWEQELRARIRAVDHGQAASFSLEDVMRDAESKLTS